MLAGLMVSLVFKRRRVWFRLRSVPLPDKARADPPGGSDRAAARAGPADRADEPHLLAAMADSGRGHGHREPRHRERAGELLAAGRAYRCFCTAEELDAHRAEAQKRGLAFLYPRTCLRLADDEVAARIAAGRPFAVRFRMSDEHVRFHDLVRGEVDFPPEALDDFILLRSDGSPTYHMSVCVDDIDMRITHVIRGEDHLSNTPKHIPLFRALGGEVPVFGHLPLILGPDRKRLSKRTGAASVEEFRAEGVLPQALYNYMALLGWAPGDDLEILTRREMIEIFAVERLNASAAVFDREKLIWVNSQSGYPRTPDLSGRLDM